MSQTKIISKVENQQVDNGFIKLNINLIGNLVTIRTEFVSESLKAYLEKERMFYDKIKITTGITTRFDESSFSMGLYDLKSDKVGSYSFSSSKRAQVFLKELNVTLKELTDILSDVQETYQEGNFELIY